GQQQDGEVLVDPADPGRVNLQDVQCTGLDQLLEHDPVLHVLAGGDLHRGDGLADEGVAEDVVRAGGLLDPVRVEALQFPDPGDGLHHVPPLVGVDGNAHAGADRFARHLHAPDVVGQVGADFQLDLGEAVRYGLLGQHGQLLV